MEEEVRGIRERERERVGEVQGVREEKEGYYETVVRCRERIEGLERELEGRLDEEDRFMGRVEVLAGKVGDLEKHVGFDKEIRRALQERIVQLEETNKVLRKYVEEGKITKEQEYTGEIYKGSNSPQKTRRGSNMGNVLTVHNTNLSRYE